MTQISRKNLLDQEEIRRSWGALFFPGQVIEVRVTDATVRNGYAVYTASGYFDNAETAIKALATVTDAANMYVTLQEIDTALIARADNRLRSDKEMKKGPTTKDEDGKRLRWLPIDTDVKRPADISSTNSEHQAALAKAAEIKTFLKSLGWPEPLEGDSGNGGHLLYQVDLAVEDAEIVKQVLTVLSNRFNDDIVHIDTGNYNPSRIWKLYGTRAGKGDDFQGTETLEARPHRVSRLLSVPEQVGTVTREQLIDLVGEQPQPDQRTAPKTSKRTNTGASPYLIGFLSKHEIGHNDPMDYKNGSKEGIKFLLDECPFCHNTDHNATVYAYSDGSFGFHCSHNSCSEKYHWHEFRAHFEPEAYAHNQQNGHTENPARQGNALRSALCRFDADDSGNGDAMFDLFGQDFLWCSSIGWFTYTGTHWQVDIDGAEIKKHAVETLRQRRHAAVDAEKEAIVKCTKADDFRVNGCVSRFKTLVSISINDFDSDPDLLNCKNGVVDLRTGTTEPHNRSQRFTYCLSVPYEEADSTEWTDYLKGVIGGGQEVIDYLQMALGYSLTGRTREEVLFYPFGPTRSGKGTVAEVYMELLPPPIAEMVDFNSFTAKREGDVSNFDLAPLKPSRMLFASESQRGQHLNPAKIKQLTGGDKINCCFKHKDFFSYRPQFKVWMLSNWPVNGDPEDDALWGRVRVIEFPNSFLGREDKSKKERLKTPEALKGVLYWTVQGAIKWYALGPTGLTAPESVVTTTNAQRAELDYVQQWLEECGDDDDEGWSSNEKVMTSYSMWCKNNNVQHPKGPKSLAQSLKAKGYEPGQQRWEDGKNKRGVGGLHIYSSNT